MCEVLDGWMSAARAALSAECRRRGKKLPFAKNKRSERAALRDALSQHSAAFCGRPIDQRRLCRFAGRLLSASCLPHAPGPMKTLATAFHDGEVHAHAARTHATGLFTHDVHSIGFRDPIPAPAAVVAAIAFGHVVTALFVYGLHLG